MAIARAPRVAPPGGVAQTRRLFAYNEAVFRRFVRRIGGLSWRQVRRRREIGHQTLFDTLVHILNVHEVWIGYIVQGKNSDAELETMFGDSSRHPKDWRGFHRYEQRVWGTVRNFLETLTPRDLTREVQAFWMPGRYTVSDGLWQTTLEQAHHLGELIAALWQDDVKPPEMTWIRVSSVLDAARARRPARPTTASTRRVRRR